jgi:exonuclease SbcD
LVCLTPNAPFKILHLADVHLDRPFVGLTGPDARARRHELRDAFERCLAVARDREVHVVTIGGDLWEDEHVTPDTCRWVADRLGAVGVPVVMIAGNHDPVRPGGPHRRVQWPSNVRIIPAQAGLHRERVGALTVWGMSWGAAPLTAAALDAFAVPADGGAHVLLLHGTAGAGAFEDGAHCPFTAAAVRAAGFELCLAGHLHSGGVREGIVVYPGSPEPLAWDETGRHTAALVELAPGCAPPTVELIDVNRRRCAETVVACGGARSSADVERALHVAVADAAGRPPINADAVGNPATGAHATQRAGTGAGAGLCLRAVLRGRVDPECRIDVEELAAATGAGIELLEVRDETEAAFDHDLLAAQPTAVGLFVRDLRARIDHCDADEPQRQRLELALELGLRAMHGDALAHAA